MLHKVAKLRTDVLQIVESVVEGKWDAPRKYRSNWVQSLALGDILWHQAIATSKYLYEERREQIQGSDEKILYDLLFLGTSDFSEIDHPWDIATWSSRYSSALVDRLWLLLEEERAKVRCKYSCEVASF